MKNWVQQVEENIRWRKLLRHNESILVAVSGGLDSMVLLHLLIQLSKTQGWKITVAHLNHQLRGRSSEADKRLVEKLAVDLKLRIISERADVKGFAKTNRLSIEMAARKLRHEFLARTAHKLKIKTIALAHHADDQVELFFLRLLRGAGTEGLSGMKWRSNSPADSSIQLIRPLLDQSKKALADYAKQNKIKFREDASNAGLDFQRNRIRHEVLPLLKTIQPGSNETILRTMEIVEAESNFVSSAAQAWLSSRKRRSFQSLSIAIQRVTIRLQMHALGLASDFALVEQLRREPNHHVSMDPTSSIYRDKEGKIHLRNQSTISFNDTEIKIDLAKQSEICVGRRKILWAFQKKTGATIPRVGNCEVFDARKIGAKVILRYWRKGDRFQPIGTKSAVKLQNLFVNSKIPRAERHQRMVAVAEQGEIFWVEGLRISECFKLDNESRCQLKWMWQNL